MAARSRDLVLADRDVFRGGAKLYPDSVRIGDGVVGYDRPSSNAAIKAANVETPVTVAGDILGEDIVFGVEASPWTDREIRETMAVGENAGVLRPRRRAGSTCPIRPWTRTRFRRSRERLLPSPPPPSTMPTGRKARASPHPATAYCSNGTRVGSTSAAARRTSC